MKSEVLPQKIIFTVLIFILLLRVFSYEPGDSKGIAQWRSENFVYICGCTPGRSRCTGSDADRS